MHSQVVARLSPALNALVNGSFKEAVERQTDWSHVDVQTFLCFLQYAYTGRYDCLKVTKLSDQELEGELKQCQTAEPSLNAWSETKKAKKARMGCRDVYKTKDKSKWLNSVVKSSKTPATSRFFDLLHTQVELFRIAHLYAISGLATLALDRLDGVLVMFDYSEKRGINDIHKLLHSCYSQQTPLPLRGVVATHIARNIQWLWNHVCIQTLSVKYSEFGRDVLEAIVRMEISSTKAEK